MQYRRARSCEQGLSTEVTGLLSTGYSKNGAQTYFAEYWKNGQINADGFPPGTAEDYQLY